MVLKGERRFLVAEMELDGKGTLFTTKDIAEFDSPTPGQQKLP
jgi:hypothetical protein